MLLGTWNNIAHLGLGLGMAYLIMCWFASPLLQLHSFKSWSVLVVQGEELNVVFKGLQPALEHHVQLLGGSSSQPSLVTSAV